MFTRNVPGQRACRSAGRQIAHCATLAMALCQFLMAKFRHLLRLFPHMQPPDRGHEKSVFTTSRRAPPRKCGAVRRVMVSCSIRGRPCRNHRIRRESTLTGRTEIWSLTPDMIGNHLFGTSSEVSGSDRASSEIWKVYWRRPNQIHNGGSHLCWRQSPFRMLSESRLGGLWCHVHSVH